jgi:hypothetical protein
LGSLPITVTPPPDLLVVIPSPRPVIVLLALVPVVRDGVATAERPEVLDDRWQDG